MTNNNQLDILDSQKLVNNWSYPADIRFGAGRVSELSAICEGLGVKRPLMVTDNGLARLPMINKITEQGKSQGIDIVLFSDVKPNPTEHNISAGVKAYKNNLCDAVIAIGGGSALDAGKTIALMVGQEKSLWSFEDIGENWRNVDIHGMACCIALPTTAGTGSEVGRASVILDEINVCKKIIFHPELIPDIVIADAELTLGLPASITAATGMDAFVHCLEAYCSPAYHPMADGIALEGMRLIKEWLPKAVVNGNDLAARSHMLVASTMGATAFQKGLGGIHALAHPLGAIYDKHHGLLNAILLPYVLIRNRGAIEEKIKHIALCLGLSFRQKNNPEFNDFYQWILDFRAMLGIPDNLADIGINLDQRILVSKMAHKDAAAAGNPVDLNEKDYLHIFENAVNGRLD